MPIAPVPPRALAESRTASMGLPRGEVPERGLVGSGGLRVEAVGASAVYDDSIGAVPLPPPADDGGGGEGGEGDHREGGGGGNGASGGGRSEGGDANDDPGRGDDGEERRDRERAAFSAPGGHPLCDGVDPDADEKTGLDPKGAEWAKRRGTAAEPVGRFRRIVRPLALGPLRLARWFLGESGSRWLSRPVELRLATIVMSVISIVIGLSLVGIWLKGSSGRSPGALSWPEGSWPESSSWRDAGRLVARAGEDRPGGEAPGSPGGLAMPGATAGAEGDAGMARGLAADLWRSGEAPRPRPAEFRRVRVKSDEGDAEPGAVSEDESGKRYWIQARALMRRAESRELTEYMTGMLVPYLRTRYGRAGSGGATISEVVEAPMPDGSGLYQVFVGPFASTAQARELIRVVKALTRQETFLFKRDPEYFAGMFPVNETRDILRHRQRVSRGDSPVRSG